MNELEVFALIDLLGAYHLGYLLVSVTIMALLGSVFYWLNVKPLFDSLKEQSLESKAMQDQLEARQVEMNEKVDAKVAELADMHWDEFSNLITNVSAESDLMIEEKLSLFEEKVREIITAEISKEADITVANINTIKAELNLSLKENTSSLNEELLKKLDKHGTDFKKSVKELDLRTRFLETFKYSKENKMGAIIEPVEILEVLLKDDFVENTAHNTHAENALETLADEIKNCPLEPDLLARVERVLQKVEQTDTGLDKFTAKVRANFKLKDAGAKK